MKQSVVTRSVAAALILGITVGCGPRPQRDASPLRGVPAELTAPTTTSTTSTTLAPPPETTPVASSPVTLYLILDDHLIQTTHDLPNDSTDQDALDELLDLSADTTLGPAVRTALPRGLTASVMVERGLAIVDTDASLLTDISPLDQRLAIGQIVLTLTSRPGIGQVSFFVDGKPQSVPRGGGDLAPASQPVAYDDYAQLITSPF